MRNKDTGRMPENKNLGFDSPGDAKKADQSEVPENKNLGFDIPGDAKTGAPGEDTDAPAVLPLGF